MFVFKKTILFLFFILKPLYALDLGVAWQNYQIYPERSRNLITPEVSQTFEMFKKDHLRIVSSLSLHVRFLQPEMPQSLQVKEYELGIWKSLKMEYEIGSVPMQLGGGLSFLSLLTKYSLDGKNENYFSYHLGYFLEYAFILKWGKETSQIFYIRIPYCPEDLRFHYMFGILWDFF